MNFTMYYGFTKSILSQGVEVTAKKARQLGFNSVEFLANEFPDGGNRIWDVKEATSAREILERYQLPVSCYSIGINLWENKNVEALLKKNVELAAQLGSPYFHHTLLTWSVLPKNAPDYDIAIRKVVKVAIRIADYADRFGITCIYEDQGLYVNGVEGFRGFWDEMKKCCGNVGICGDLGNILEVGETPQDFLEVFAEDICHVHVKDYLWKKAIIPPGKNWEPGKDGSWLRDTIIGDGIVDFEACLKILKRVGYQGCFALENSHPEPYEEGVHQAMEYLQRFW